MHIPAAANISLSVCLPDRHAQGQALEPCEGQSLCFRFGVIFKLLKLDKALVNGKLGATISYHPHESCVVNTFINTPR